MLDEIMILIDTYAGLVYWRDFYKQLPHTQEKYQEYKNMAKECKVDIRKKIISTYNRHNGYPCLCETPCPRLPEVKDGA